jgi:S-adenosylmethionine synthetase
VAEKLLPHAANCLKDEDVMPAVSVESSTRQPVGSQAVELVERKGLGHPDTICDQVMESVSVALSRYYREKIGHVLHHNIDKGLLVAGQSAPALGGGVILRPMRIIFGDRAVAEWKGIRIPVGEIAHEAADRWISGHLRFVDPKSHLVYQNEIQPGSMELQDIFVRGTISANDTSAAVGYAPFTETEQLVLEAESYLNSPAFKARFPEVGEDVKVMGVRRDRSLELTIAIAMVDRFVPNEAKYFESKAAVRDDLGRHLGEKLDELDRLTIEINTLDVTGRGLAGMYLTVLGTSAECGDGGQVGRGNRVNGLIALSRPMTTEAAAGKNPISHVGKIYNLLCHDLAHRIYSGVGGIEEVYIWLCSQIGHPITEPWVASVQLVLRPDATLGDVAGPVRAIVLEGLAGIPAFCDRLTRGELPVC